MDFPCGSLWEECKYFFTLPPSAPQIFYPYSRIISEENPLLLSYTVYLSSLWPYAAQVRVIDCFFPTA